MLNEIDETAVEAVGKLREKQSPIAELGGVVAAGTASKKRSRLWIRWCALAACAVIAVGLIKIVPEMTRMGNEIPEGIINPANENIGETIDPTNKEPGTPEVNKTAEENTESKDPYAEDKDDLSNIIQSPGGLIIGDPLCGWETSDEENYNSYHEERCGNANEDGTLPKGGWKRIYGKWYYYNADGSMVTNSWARDSRGWCYIGSEGYMVEKTKWIRIDGDWYHITKGYRDHNKWMKDSKGWCYLKSNGKMLTNDWEWDSKGQCWIGPEGYFLEETILIEYVGDTYGIENGYMVVGRSIIIDGEEYTFGENGKLIDTPPSDCTPGWNQAPNGDWYYMKEDGTMANDWLEIEDVMYSFTEGGKLRFGQKGEWDLTHSHFILKNGGYAKGVCLIDHNYYYFSAEDGSLMTGWIKDVTFNEASDRKATYYANEEGVLQVKWQTIDGSKYYFDNCPAISYRGMYQGKIYTIYEDGSHEKYYFADDGKLQIGLIEITVKGYFRGRYLEGKKRIYTDENGALQKGWQEINGEKYYFDEDYFMVMGQTIKIDGVEYTFDESGRLVP